MAALIQMIKVTKNPIICICNERGDQQVRALSAHCLDLKFRRPENTQVAKRIKGMMQVEGKKVDQVALESIIAECGQDLRQVINQVQFFGTLATSAGSQKDTQLMLSPFDACCRLLSMPAAGNKPMSMATKQDLHDIDADFMPLMIHENYLRPFERGGRAAKGDELERSARAAELIAMSDSLSDGFGSATSATLGVIYPSFLTSTPTNFTKPSFPVWLQRRGAVTKGRRGVQEMYSRLRAHTTCSLQGLVISSYHIALHAALMAPLARGDVKAAAQQLVGIGLTRDFFTEQAPSLRTPLSVDDPYRRLDGRLKHQLLQAIQALSAAPGPAKRKKREGDADGVPKRDGVEAGDGDAAVADDEDADGPGEFEEDGNDGIVSKTTKKKCVQAAAKVPSTVKGVDLSKCSLSSWIPKKPRLSRHTSAASNASGVGRRGEDDHEPMIVLKYIEGHTCAVRRTVALEDMVGEWRGF